MKIKIKIGKKELAKIMAKSTVKKELKLDSETIAKAILKSVRG
ncbi:MAG: hypothetical protein ACI4SF_12850 [Oscillospiraceae bacterium]